MPKAVVPNSRHSLRRRGAPQSRPEASYLAGCTPSDGLVRPAERLLAGKAPGHRAGRETQEPQLKRQPDATGAILPKKDSF